MTASVPRLGLGTWQIGDEPSRHKDELAALRTGLDLGFPMIDTAEMYGDGIAEILVGEAIAGRRDGVYLVTKVLPQNASRSGVVAACERSLKRLRTDRVDLYLLHWPGPHPIAETVAGFERLVADGKVLRWGVSNFDVEDLDAMARAAGGGRCAANADPRTARAGEDGPSRSVPSSIGAVNQCYWNLAHRGVERRVLPWCRARGVVLQAYTPLDQGRLAKHAAVKKVAARHGVAASAVAFAWTAREPGTSSVAKSGRADRVRELAAALTLRLAADDLRELDAAFPVSTEDGPLETI